MKYIFSSLILLFCLNYITFAQDTTVVSVEFSSGENVLQGTLVLPENPDNVPVLLFLGGIDEYGDPHRNRESFITENLLSIFPPSGVAVFYYDPRGVEESDGKWHHATLRDFAIDAEAAIAFLKQRDEIDGDRIGVLGHGEGGWIAQIVAAENPDDIEMMASLAGPTFDAELHLANEYHNSYVCDGMDSTRAYQKAKEKAISHENWVSIFPLTKRWRHMKMKQDFDPAEVIKQIEIPSLFVFGEQDGVVYPSWGIDALNEIFPDSVPSNIHVETIPGANHYFKVNDRCYEYEEDDIAKSYSFRFKEVLRNWVFGNL